MILLQQQDFEFFARPDPQQNIVTLAVFGGLLVIGVLAAIIGSKISRSGKRRGRIPRMAIRRYGRQAGLKPHHVQTLMEMVGDLKVDQPLRLFQSEQYLTNVVRREIMRIDQSSLSDGEKEDRKFLVFQIKRLLTLAISQSGGGIASTRRLVNGQAISLSIDGDFWYDSRVTANVSDSLAVEAPMDSDGSAVLWSKGTKVFGRVPLRGGQNVVTFTSAVRGISRSHGIASLLLNHDDHLSSARQRKYPRREADQPVFFWPIVVLTTGSGRRTKKQAFVSSQRRGYGRLEDVSAGGCSIRTPQPLATGNLVKISFETPDKTRLTAFGKVKTLERLPGRYSIMHIQFTKVSKKHLNRIQAYVYGLEAHA
ncbi:MAG: PilZ domain-containing protein [Spirochaetota bacterium]